MNRDAKILAPILFAAALGMIACEDHDLPSGPLRPGITSLTIVDPGPAGQVTTGQSTACGLASTGTIVCWGNSDLGMTNAPSGIFTQIDGASSHFCALRTNGTPACWGYDGGNGAMSPPPQAFTQIAVGAFETCGVLASGVASCTAGDQTPVPGGTFTQVSTGFFHSCGIRPDGTLTCWGRNGLGQSTPPGGVFTDVSAGLGYTCAVETSGQVSCWGDDEFGQATPPGGAFVQVSAGSRHTCGVKVDSSIECWGWNEFGQRDAPNETFTQVSASWGGFTCALRTNHSVLCWGLNALGQTDVPNQEITFESSPPMLPIAGTGYVVTATGGASGHPVTYSSLTATTCSVAGSVVLFLSAGTCTIAADQGGNSNYFRALQATQRIDVAAANAAPVADPAGAYTGFEGEGLALSGAASTDPDGNALTYDWDFGDGSTGTGVAPSHAYADNATYTVSLTVTDAHGVASAPVSTTAIIGNVAPTITGLTLLTDPVPVGSTVVLSGTFTDPSSLDTHTATVDWDDAAGAAAAAVNSSARTVSASRRFTEAGVYTVSLTVTDDDNGSVRREAAGYLVVFDPSAGFVTGGGWITSPAGAYAIVPALTGKASFGFVSRYKEGASTPSGNTEFQFHAAGFTFSSSTYQWLVVAGAKAKYKGTGTVNGSGNYGFMLSATDGQGNGGGGIDKFRMKIWDLATGNVIYDNQAGSNDEADAATALGGGSIVIHK